MWKYEKKGLKKGIKKERKKLDSSLYYLLLVHNRLNIFSKTFNETDNFLCSYKGVHSRYSTFPEGTRGPYPFL